MMSPSFRVYVFTFYSELIIRITVCFAACMQWTKHQNTNVYGGIYDVASTLADCQAACVNKPGCNGIDYVVGNPPGCWLSGTWSGGRNNDRPGVTHYDYETCGTEPQRNNRIVSFLRVGPA